MLLFSTFAAAACPADVQTFTTRLSRAEVAFGSMQLTPFKQERAAIEQEVLCLAEKLEAPLVARLHRVRAMGAFLERDQPGTVEAFQAQLAADPSLALPEKYAAQHPLRRLYEQAVDAEDPSRPLTPVSDVQIWVDGHQTGRRPTGRTALFQITGSEGLLRSQLLPPAETLEVPRVASVPAPGAPSLQRRRVPAASIGLGVAAGLAAGAAVGFFASGRVAKARYDDPTTPFEDLDELRAKTNRRHIGAQVLGAGAVGLGAVAVISGVL